MVQPSLSAPSDSRPDVAAVLGADVVERADVRVVQRGDRAGLALEPLFQIGVGREEPGLLDRGNVTKALLYRPGDTQRGICAQALDELCSFREGDEVE